MKRIHLSELQWGYIATWYALQTEECRCYLLIGYKKNLYICKTVECYIDDITVKSRAKEDNFANLIEVFDLMRAHQLKINPAKSFLAASSGKFIRFIVTSRGIHMDSKKVRAIQELQLPRSLLELRGLKDDLYTFGIHIQSLQSMRTLQQANGEESVLHMG